MTPPITSLVPHRAPMLLADEVSFDDGVTTRVKLTIRRELMFMTDAGLPNWVGVELMAQAVAAWAGLRRLEKKEGVQLGFLLGTRKYECAIPLFPIGAVVEVEVSQELVTPQGLAVFACVLACEGNVVARAQLNAFQPENVEKYLSGGDAS